MTRISVCMATYNGQAFVEQQLRSILVQLGPDDEVVISDDLSTDGTVHTIQQLGDSRVRLLPAKQFGSAVLNFEYTLNHVSGEYVFLADQDDIWLANKVNVMLKELQTADLVVSDCSFINEVGMPIGDSYFHAYKSGHGFVKNFVKNTYLGNCMAFRRALLSRVLPFPRQLHKASKLSLYHDVWIGLVANLWFRVRFIPDILSAYRRHSANASPTEISAKSPNSLFIKGKARWLLAVALLNRALATR